MKKIFNVLKEINDIPDINVKEKNNVSYNKSFDSSHIMHDIKNKSKNFKTENKKDMAIKNVIYKSLIKKD